MRLNPPRNKEEEEGLFQCMTYKHYLSGLLTEGFTQRVRDKYDRLIAAGQYEEFHNLFRRSQISITNSNHTVKQYIQKGEIKIAAWIFEALDPELSVNLKDMDLSADIVLEMIKYMTSPLRVQRICLLGNLQIGKVDHGGEAMARLLSLCDASVYEVNLCAIGLIPSVGLKLADTLEEILSEGEYTLQCTVKHLDLSSNYELGRAGHTMEGINALLKIIRLCPMLEELNLKECGIVRQHALLLQNEWGVQRPGLIMS